MKPESLIFLYTYISFCAVFFDLFFIVYTRVSSKTSGIRRRRIEKRLRAQIKAVKTGGAPDKTVQKALVRKLRRPGNMGRLNECIEQLREEDADGLERYLATLHSGLLVLSKCYSKKAHEYKALFSYVLTNMKLGDNPYVAALPVTERLNFTLMLQQLENYLKEPSVYVRENTFRAIVSWGQTDVLIGAIYYMNEHVVELSEKLVSDNMLSFSGDKGELADRLVDVLEQFEPAMQCAIINFLRFLPDRDLGENVWRELWHDKLFEMLQRKSISKEVHFSIIRYFKKFPFDDALDTLTGFARLKDERRWEYAAIASSALASYPYEESKQALLVALHSYNWYVRANASDSLLDMGYDAQSLAAASNDAFAADMLEYKNTVRRLKKQRAGEMDAQHKRAGVKKELVTA